MTTKAQRMKTVKTVPYVLQDLFVLLMFICAVWGCILLWTDAEYANFAIGMVNRTMGYDPSPDGATVMHKVFFTVLLAAFTVFLTFVLVDDNSIKKIKGSKGE